VIANRVPGPANLRLRGSLRFRCQARTPRLGGNPVHSGASGTWPRSSYCVWWSQPGKLEPRDCSLGCHAIV